MSQTPYDHIIIGGGTAGCVMAARLSEDPSRNVLLLEAGHEGRGLMFDMPAGSFGLIGNAKADWIYPVEADASAAGRTSAWAGGKVLGGSSGINGMVYIRGQRGDYADWVAEGCTGWGWDDLYPYFLKAERFEGPTSPVHGRNGPLSVSPPRVLHELVPAFLEAAGQSGMPPRQEYCDGELSGSFVMYGTTRDGRRCSTRKAYLDPLLGRRPNLTVMSGVVVDKLLLEGRRAVGVCALVNGQRQTFHARGDIVLSAGTLASPGVLLRSGIGPGADLQALGIPVVADLPGVGRNLQEHNGLTQSWRVNVPTYNTMVGPLRLVGHLLQYLTTRRGILSSIAVHAMAYFRSSPELAEPDMCMSLLPLAIAFNDGKPALAKQPGLSCGPQVLRPSGRGRLRLRSADPAIRPVIEHALLGHERDLALIVHGSKVVRDLFNAPALRPHVLGPMEPNPMPTTDSEWADFARQRVGIGYHPVGTCRMGVGDDAVVDPALKVRGIDGLRVVDASVMPRLISGNTNAPTIAMAEKAAAMMRGAG